MHRHLCDAVELLWLRQAGSFQDGWSDVGAVSELAAQASFVLDAFWPANDHRVANAAEVRSYLLSPLERRVSRPSPPCGIVRSHVWPIPFLQAALGFNRF